MQMCHIISTRDKNANRVPHISYLMKYLCEWKFSDCLENQWIDPYYSTTSTLEMVSHLIDWLLNSDQLKF